jgi:prephenate dehydrogenase
MFVFGETIRRLDFDITESLNFVSPVYKMIISSVARYLDQNPKLYSDIQIYNPEVLQVHKTFMEVTEHYNRIVKDKDETAFIETANASKEFF